MLRRKFMFTLAPLVVLLLATVVAAIWMLQGILGDLRSLQIDDSAVDQLSVRFQWLVLALGVVFFAVINVAVLVLLKMAGSIVRPVERLVHATQELGQEHFDYRVRLDRHDEFDQLASAYNDLAQRLQTNEQRKVEVLQQVAVAINHELNNALAVIELQLKRISRRAGECPGLENCLNQIHASLEKVTATAHALQQVRRIVLTDYAPGTKMLDLERSSRDESVAAPTAAAH
jgi:nitrogen fixation/metabolism regulation signal transduction histidine kinase